MIPDTAEITGMPQKMLKPTLMAMLSIILCSPTWAINKCTNPDDKVVYQDAPCSGKGETIVVKPAAGELSPEDVGTAKAVAAHRIFIGMKEKDVLRSWGRPTKINRSVSAESVSEQWVYERGNYQNQYIYLRNFVVTSVQSPD